MKRVIFSLSIIIMIGLIVPGGYADHHAVPDWVKNTAGWWATDAISENEFVNAIEFLINEEILIINETSNSKTSENVPDWVKNTAGWWATDAISENEFYFQYRMANIKWNHSVRK